MTEIRPIPSWPDYFADSDGAIWSTKRGGMYRLSANPDRGGYLVVNMADRTVRVHRAVAEAFYGPLPAGLETRHLDGTRTNNRPENLRYGTRSENQLDRKAHGTDFATLITHCRKGHPYEGQNLYVTPSGKRDCRTCRREASRRYRRADR